MHTYIHAYIHIHTYNIANYNFQRLHHQWGGWHYSSWSPSAGWYRLWEVYHPWVYHPYDDGDDDDDNDHNDDDDDDGDDDDDYDDDGVDYDGGGDGDHDDDDDGKNYDGDDGHDDDDEDDGEDYEGDDGHHDDDGDDDGGGGDDDDVDECNCVYDYLQYYCSRMPTISGIHPSYMEHRDAHSGGQKERILSSLPFWSHIKKNHLSSTVFKSGFWDHLQEIFQNSWQKPSSLAGFPWKNSIQKMSFAPGRMEPLWITPRHPWATQTS